MSLLFSFFIFKNFIAQKKSQKKNWNEFVRAPGKGKCLCPLNYSYCRTNIRYFSKCRRNKFVLLSILWQWQGKAERNKGPLFYGQLMYKTFHHKMKVAAWKTVKHKWHHHWGMPMHGLRWSLNGVTVKALATPRASVDACDCPHY